MRNNFDHSLNVLQGGMTPGPMVLVGLGPRPHGPYCWVRAQGPIGPGDPGAIQEALT